MLKLLDKVNIAHPPRASSEAKDAENRRPSESGEASASAAASPSPPWSPKLASFLLTLSPILPDATVSKLVQYYWSQHLCLPSNPDWLANIRALLQAFFYRNVPTSPQGQSEPNARYDLVSLVFDHVYNAVQDLNAERNLFMTEIVLPLANSTLSSETDARTESLIRSVLVHAAVLSGSQIPGPVDPDAEAVASKQKDQSDSEFEEVFVEVRKLLCRLARSASHKAVAFDVPAGTADDEEGKSPSHAQLGSSASEGKARNAALDMIAIFNRMAFSTPWIANSVDRDIDLSIRQQWEKKTRAGCIAIFRDLLELLKVRQSSGAGSTTASSAAATSGTVCTSTRLVILEWLLRFRTDRQHRVYLAGDLDELISESATVLMKGPGTRKPNPVPTSRQGRRAAPQMRAREPAPRWARARNEREGREAQRNAEAAARSKSRLRELSRERGRAERVSEPARRQAEPRDRSSSQQRAVRPATYEHMWRLPQAVSFRDAQHLAPQRYHLHLHPPSSDMECCAGNTHLHSDKDACRRPSPCPSSWPQRSRSCAQSRTGRWCRICCATCRTS